MSPNSPQSSFGVVLSELGVPEDVEGVVAIQVFSARRSYTRAASFDAAGAGLDGAWLRLGELPDAYLRARAFFLGQRTHLLALTVGAAKPLYEHVQDAALDPQVDRRLTGRPMALLVGWRAASLPDPELTGEYDRGVRLRSQLHDAVGRLAAALSLGLTDFLMDRVDMCSFWTAPSRSPFILLGESSASGQLFAPSHLPFPRAEVEDWIRQIGHLPESVYGDIEDALELVAAARAAEPGWLRFTLGWAALERLAAKLGSRFDDQVAVEQRLCQSCGAPVSPRKPTLVPRLEVLARALQTPDISDQLRRVNELRGRSHIGKLPQGPDLTAPEELASTILRGVVANHERIPR